MNEIVDSPRAALQEQVPGWARLYCGLADERLCQGMRAVEEHVSLMPPTGSGCSRHGADPAGD